MVSPGPITVLAGFMKLPGRPWAIDLLGSTVYLAAAEGGLRVVDVADPRAPAEVRHVDAAGRVFDVYVTDGHAYVAASA